MTSLRLRRAVLLLPVLACVLLAGAVPAASAQCFGPDNLDIAGACCQPNFANLPPFPAASLPGLGICWNNCAVASTNPLKVAWATPAQPFCGEFTTPLTVSDGTSGATLLTGTLVLDYTRTWNEVDTAGTVTQVWRFTAKADLSAAAGAPAGACPLPTCIAPAGPWPTAFYYGYVDYVSCAVAGPWENVLVLFHNCDRFIHAPGLSSRPGVFHPGRSYAIVAPHSTVQPFIPMNSIAAGGPLVGEATRDVNSIVGAPCTTEDPVIAGAMTPLGAGCVCTMTLNPKQQTLRKFDGTTLCPTTAGGASGWASLNINFPFLPWLHMVSTSIGTWASPAVYPGQEACWVDEGLFAVQDACTGDFVELKYGASTAKGWPVLLPIPVIVTNFTDLADNYSAPLFGPYPLPLNGNVMPTDHLVYVNEP